MILQALCELAQREKLLEDLDFELRGIPFVIVVDKVGKLVEILDTRTASQAIGKRKAKPKPKIFPVPREFPRQSGDRAFFLYDKADYIFGLDAGTVKKDILPEKLRARKELFRQRIRECLGSTNDEGVEAVLAFLTNYDSGLIPLALPKDCGSSDLFAFCLADNPGEFVSERPKVKDYWKKVRSLEDARSESGTCLVTGEEGALARLFPPQKKVPGGNTSGVSLVSFNSAAFESYGWKNNQNARISRTAAEGAATALDRLLDETRFHLGRRSLRLGSDSIVCYWPTDCAGDIFADSLASLFEADPEQVAEVYRSIWRGIPPKGVPTSAFYALTLSGAQARAVVRGWFESTVADVTRNVALHFADIDLACSALPAQGKALPPCFSISLLLESITPLGDRARIIPPDAEALVGSALSGLPYPFSFLQRALVRARAEIGKDDWLARRRMDARVGLLKAILNRRKRLYPQTTGYQEVTRDMDPINNNPGYLLGRLMAVLEHLQRKAIGDVNATVIDRFFGGASATPRAVFPRLLKNARNHASKAGHSAVYLDRMIDDIVTRFDMPNGIPAHLDLEQQSHFVIGYHHMRKWLWMNSEERSAWVCRHSDAPRAYGRTGDSTLPLEVNKEN